VAAKPRVHEIASELGIESKVALEKLKELDTSKVEPTSHVLPIKNIFREDEVRPSLSREEMLKNARTERRSFQGSENYRIRMN